MDKAGRGWNDPPSMPVASMPSPSTTVSTAKRSGISLNKRIAFPISGPVPAANTESGHQPMMTPPKMSVMPPMIPGIPPTMPPKCSTCDINTPSLEVVSGNIDKILLEAHDIEHKPDIVKRIEEMKKMWREGLLNNLLCYKIFQISQALLDEDVDQALNLQVELLAHWPSESSKWAAALRCLINHQRLSKVPPDVDNSEENCEADLTT